MAKRMLSRLEVIKANEMMKLHLVPSDREGFFNYQEGWDDARIAQELDPLIQASAIGNLRREVHGDLDTAKNAASADNRRLKELETLVSNLLSCYGELEVKYNKLIDTLVLNRTADVKHLKTTVKENNNASK